MQRQTQHQPQARLRERTSPEDMRTLAAACDMAVLRALELVGKRVAREERSRFGAMHRAGLAWADVHTVWRAEPRQVDAALAGAWTVLPRLTSEHGCCNLVEPELNALLDSYVRSLVTAQRPHSFSELEARLRDAVERP